MAHISQQCNIALYRLGRNRTWAFPGSVQEVFKASALLSQLRATLFFRSMRPLKLCENKYQSEHRLVSQRLSNAKLL